MNFPEMEKRAEELIQQEQVESAVKLMYEIIVAFAKAKDFNKAEAWREKLMEVDSMALSEIVNSAEIINAEKLEAIDEDHKKIWATLYNSLTQEEGNSLYFGTKALELPPEKIFIQQGKLNDKLFFIDSGTVNIIYKQGEKELFLTKLDPGKVIGQDTFFPISICTTSMFGATPLKLRFLNRAALLKIDKEYPGFQNKLQDYCASAGPASADLLKDKSVERRMFERDMAAGKTTLQIHDAKGQAVGAPFHGRMEDISAAGASFHIKCSQNDTARSLLGKVTTLLIELENKQRMKAKGHIVGVQSHNFGDYAIHFRFLKPFTTPDLNILLSKE
jgi:hypothetical protein